MIAESRTLTDFKFLIPNDLPKPVPANLTIGDKPSTWLCKRCAVDRGQSVRAAGPASN
jgi:hypothetical protein